jgi:hypothetical protein
MKCLADENFRGAEQQNTNTSRSADNFLFPGAGGQE